MRSPVARPLMLFSSITPLVRACIKVAHSLKVRYRQRQKLVIITVCTIEVPCFAPRIFHIKLVVCLAAACAGYVKITEAVKYAASLKAAGVSP
jgi:hypothetical protein